MSPRAFAAAGLVLALLAVQAPTAAGQDTTIIFTTTIVETTFLGGAASSATMLQGSGSIDGSTASTGGDSIMSLTLAGGGGGFALGSYSSASFGGGGGGGPDGPGGGPPPQSVLDDDDSGGGAGDAAVAVLGAIRATIKAIQGPSSFERRIRAVTGRNGTILIRGTGGAGRAAPAQAAADTTITVEARTAFTRLRTYEGAAAIQNLRGTVKTVEVPAGYESIVRGDRPPTKARRFRYPRYPFWEPR